jgi:hypothetical protein
MDSIRPNACPPTLWMLWLAVLFLASAGMSAHAQVLDRVELIPAAGGETEIVLRMSTSVLYQRHAPLGSGAELRIFLRLTGVDPMAGPREYLNSPPSTLIPRFQLSFPENDGSLLVAFESATAYRLSQGRDSRSISIFVPTRAASGEPGSASKGAAESR